LVDISANSSVLKEVATLPEFAGPVVVGSALSDPDELMEKPRIWLEVVVA
jgi:hypothetical protein